MCPSCQCIFPPNCYAGMDSNVILIYIILFKYQILLFLLILFLSDGVCFFNSTIGIAISVLDKLRRALYKQDVCLSQLISARADECGWKKNSHYCGDRRLANIFIAYLIRVPKYYPQLHSGSIKDLPDHIKFSQHPFCPHCGRHPPTVFIDHCCKTSFKLSNVVIDDGIDTWKQCIFFFNYYKSYRLAPLLICMFC